MRMRVLTLNCWNVTEPFAARMTVLRTALEPLAPDVLALQEIVVREDGLDQAGMILDGLGYERVFGPAANEVGNVIASRWPIRRPTVRPLPGGETERRSVLAALIETPAGTLPFLTTHLNWRPDHGPVRERQVIAIADLVPELVAAASLPPILVGDLNAEAESNEIRFLCGRTALDGRRLHLRDAWPVGGDGTPGFTWDNRNHFAAAASEPDRRIDYILVAPGARIASARLAFTEPAGDVFASDHFGVLVDVAV
jgi:endonuclease/exonuclease/phosphatase family metal-dependent hydrolase